MRSVVVDANVFVSFFVERNAAQHSAARALLSAAEDGEIAGIIPQSVVFEIAYVLHDVHIVQYRFDLADLHDPGDRGHVRSFATAGL